MIYEYDMYGDDSPTLNYRNNFDRIFKGDTEMATKKKMPKKYDDEKMEKKDTKKKPAPFKKKGK